MIKTQDAIDTARALLGTPYAELDCINLIKRVIRTAPGGVPWYTKEQLHRFVDKGVITQEQYEQIIAD